MRTQSLFYFKGLAWLLFTVLLLSACRSNPASPTSPVELTPPENTSETSSAFSPTPSPTLPAPTPTPQALAARVNDQAISLERYQAELGRFQAAVNRELNQDDHQRVLESLVNELLLAQSATENGYTLDNATLQERLEELAQAAGGQDALNQWMEANGYSEASFLEHLDLAIRAAWMRDQIVAQVSTTQEQVHARQVLFKTIEEANQAFAQLQAGADFLDLAKTSDPIAGGELGWFPRGYLFFPELEEAIFQLQPGQYTDVIQTPSGFHIVFVIEREQERPIDSQVFVILQENALQKWLEEQRQQSSIEILASTNN